MAMVMPITMIISSMVVCVMVSLSLSPAVGEPVSPAAMSLASVSATGGNGHDNDGCVWTYTSGSTSFTYDLSPMKKTVGDYQGEDTAYRYKANVCGPSNSNAECGARGASICQYRLDDNQFANALGSYTASPPTWSLINTPTSGPEPYTAGVMYTYTNGDLCWVAGNQQPRTVLNVFRCSQTPSDMITIAEDITCTFTITYQSTQSCPGSGPTPSTGGPQPGPSSSGLSGGWIFIIILLVVVPVYITAGCIYKVKKAGVPFGRESCPNGEFWGAIPGLCRDGVKYTFYMIKSGCKSGKGEAYNEL